MKWLFLCALLLSKVAGASEVDTSKFFTGTWHEIYSMHQRFQKGCYNVSFDYTEKGKDRYKITNHCHHKDGSLKKTIEGEILAVDAAQGCFKAYYFRPFGLNIFGGEFYVLKTGPDYRWAIVGTKDRDYGWVISRETSLSEKDLEIIRKELKELGFDFSLFSKTQLEKKAPEGAL